MADLESLTNEQLRLRLLEFGFANMPVTQTTRNVLLKKLRNALEGEKTKTRRETVHITKYSSGEEDNIPTAKKTNRRATMAVPSEPPRTATPSKPVRKSVTPQRKTNTTTTPEKRGRGRPSKLPSSAEFDSVEETDEELKEYIETRTKRSSKSPSLVKTQVVTTSYKNKSVVVEDDEDEEVTEPEIDERPVRKPSPAHPALDRADLRRRATLTTTAVKTNNYDVEVDEFTVPKFSRPSVSTSYNTSYTSPTYNNRRYTSYVQQNDDTFEVNDNKPDVNTPYLSDFTRRLQKLKAEPLSTPIKPAIPRGTGVYYRTGKNSQVPLNQVEQSDTLGGSIKEVFRSLASYKKTFLFLFVLLIALFVFVMYYL